MDGERQLFRSRDALAGGVCAGIADYFGVDPIVVRILTVILSLATSGLAAIAYLVLWMMLPKAPERPAPYEVTPQHVHSDTYGTIDCDRARSASETAAASAASTHPPMYGAYRGVGHVPPEPPASFPHGTAPASPGSAASTPPAPAASAPPAPAAPTPAGNPVHAGDPAHSGGAKAALVFGILLLFCGVLALVSKFIIGVAWWQFWPLALVIVGIVQMVVPGERGRRAKKFSGGLILFCMGASLLPISLGAFDCATIARTFANLWPLLVIMAGLFVMGGALFSMHFGASCMLYPMTWGKESGSAVYLAYAGVFLSGILITLLGYTALSRGNDSFWGLTKRIAPRFGTVLCSLVVLLVGPVYVIPRMSASAWDAILQLLGVESLGTLPVVLFNLVVYGIIFWFIAGKVKVTDRIGKILTPIQVLIVLAVAAIVIVIHAVNRRVLQLKYSLIWLLISLCLVVTALFPKIAFGVTALVGIETPSNMIFFLAIIALLGICFSLTVIVSRQEARIKRLVQLLSIEHNEYQGSEEEEHAAAEGENK